MRAYLQSAATPSRFTDIAGDPDPQAPLFPPEALTFAIPKQFKTTGVNVYGDTGIDT